VKVTKTAENQKRIAGNGVARVTRKLERLRDGKVRESDGRFYSRAYVPIIIHDPEQGIVVRPARYLLRRPQDTPATDIERSGCFNARRDSLTKYWRGQFGATHALLPAAAFYENVKGKELKFTPDNHSDMLIACLYAVGRWLAPEGRNAGQLQAVLNERERPYCNPLTIRTSGE
jgi:putative SOS response-associated peptidase YedK